MVPADANRFAATMPHYFDPAPRVPSRPGRVTLAVPGFEAELTVDRGVFSAGGVDQGTVELLRSGAGSPPGPRDGETLLDLGCGYGPIALTLARRHPGATVWAVDVNARALELAAANASDLGLAPRIRVATPEEVPAELAFDGIWSNPPIRIGKEAVHALMQQWLPRLRPPASAWLVVHRHLGADSLAAWLGGQGWMVRRIGSKKGYRLLQVGRPRSDPGGADT
jgi:16S rRNA (guanine1207-N2)-methyltransferase